MSRMLLRKVLIEIVGKEKFIETSPSLQTIIKFYEDNKIINHELLDKVKKLRHITYYVEWHKENPPTKAEWKWAVSESKLIIKELLDLY